MDERTPDCKDDPNQPDPPDAVTPPESRSAEDEPRILGLRRKSGGWSVDRRAFLTVGITGAIAESAEGGENAALAPSGEAAGAAALQAARKMLESKSVSDTAFDVEKPRDQPGSHREIVSNCQEIVAHLKPISALAVSRDGATLASYGEGEGVKLWDLRAKAHIHTLEETASLSVRRLALAPDGLTLYIGTADGKIRVRSLSGSAAGTIELTRHSQAIRVLEISPDGSLLASASVAGDVVIGDSSNSRRCFSLADNRSPATGLGISPGQELLAVGRISGEASILLFPDGDSVANISPFGAPVDAVSFSPDGQWIVVVNRTTIAIWDMKKRELVKTTSVPSTGQVAWAPDSKALATTETDVVRIRSVPDLSPRFTLRGHQGAITGLVFAGDQLVSAGSDRTIRLWSWSAHESRGCLLDIKCTPEFVKGTQYKSRSEFGSVVTYTLPCGSPIPTGATCICNCVPGTLPMPQVPKNHARRVVGSVCTCDTVCTCNTVCSCVSNVSSGGGLYWYPN